MLLGRSAAMTNPIPDAGAAPDGLEAARIATALALKLGCRKIALFGCESEAVERCMGAPPQAQVMQPPYTSVTDLSDGLAVIATRLLRSGDVSHWLPAVMRQVPAAVVMDPDDEFGIDEIESLVDGVRDAGLTVVHRSFVRGRHPAAPRWSPLLVIGDGHDPRPAALLAAGARGLALDPDVDLGDPCERRARICVASYEVGGPTRNGGIGTANTSLAIALGRAGHDVTLLFTGDVQPDRASDRRLWERRFANEGVRFEILSSEPWSSVRSPHSNVRRAYELYRWLRANEGAFDVVHFPECQGHGYFAVLARRQRLAFAHTVFVAGVHSCTRWCSEANRELPRSIDALVDEHLEKTSVELADVVISPSAYMLDYLQERGWSLPDRQFVQQYVLSSTSRIRSDDAAPLAQRIEEIVFFGRLEVRKGIETFCDALDRIAESDPQRPLRITFLGRPEHVLGEPATDYLTRRSHQWPWRYEVLGDVDQETAIGHLRSRRCLAVMPSTVDNSPNSVSEALSLQIPMITTRSGGVGELIDPLDLRASTFAGLQPADTLPPVPAEHLVSEMSARELAERIVTALDSPVIPRFAIDHEAGERIHVGWNVRLAAKAADPRCADDTRPGLAPSVSVAVLHRDQGEGLVATLESLAAQADQLLDVVIVDDASHTDASFMALKRAEDICSQRGWPLLRRERHHAAAAREQMVAATRGDLLVFLGCGERLAAGALSVIRRTAGRRAAEAFTWPTADPDNHYPVRPIGLDAPPPSDDPSPIVVPVGGPPLVGVVYPAFSTGPYAIRRGVLHDLGFASDARGLDVDTDVLNRVLLTGGVIEVIAEPLTIAVEADSWAAVRGAVSIGLAQTKLNREEAVRLARPFAALLPAALRDLAGLQLTVVTESADQRIRAVSAYKELDNTRHHQAEYIAYLEREHHLLAAQIQDLRAAARRGPVSSIRTAVERVRRQQG